MTEPPIVAVIQRYHPGWEPPKDMGKDWSSCRCPFHDDTVASGAVNYALGAYNCLGCGVKGGPIQIIKQLEAVTYREAIRIAEELSEGSDTAVPPKPAGVSRRRVPGDSGTCVRLIDTRDNPSVPTRFRRKPPRWT